MWIYDGQYIIASWDEDIHTFDQGWNNNRITHFLSWWKYMSHCKNALPSIFVWISHVCWMFKVTIRLTIGVDVDKKTYLPKFFYVTYCFLYRYI